MLIGDRGEQHGVMPIKQALEFARDIGTDLVEVSPNTDPPVCRLLDYGKLRYMSAKKERESRKSQKGTELKEMRFRPNIGEHDLQSKLRKVKEMIDDCLNQLILESIHPKKYNHEWNGTLLKEKTI